MQLSSSPVHEDAFRKIEKPGERSLDAIAVAATSAFASLQRPTRQDRAQLDTLIRPNIGELSAQSLTSIAATLCNSRHAPVKLLHALSALPIEISAALVIRSPLLTDDYLEMLAAQRGEGHRIAVAKRFELRNRTGEAGTDPRRLVFSRAIQNAFRERDPIKPHDAMIAAVCTGHDVALADAGDNGAPAMLSERLLAFALSENPAFLATCLCDLLDLPFYLTEAAVADPSAGEFSTMLKALDADTATAMAVILATGRASLADADRIRLAFSRYVAMDGRNARETVAHWRDMSDTATAPAANTQLRAVNAA